MKKETQIGGTAADPCYAGRDNPIRASGIKKTRYDSVPYIPGRRSERVDVDPGAAALWA